MTAPHHEREAVKELLKRFASASIDDDPENVYCAALDVALVALRTILTGAKDPAEFVERATLSHGIHSQMLTIVCEQAMLERFAVKTKAIN